jgi:hypothetical protein
LTVEALLLSLAMAIGALFGAAGALSMSEAVFGGAAAIASCSSSSRNGMA